MRLFFVLALGRSGTHFLASLLAQDPGARVHHEPDPGDPKLLALRYAGGFDTVVEALLEERFARLLAEAEDRGARVYGEANSYLRYESDWLARRFQPTLIHLVRDGRAFVRSAFTRTVYTPWEEQQPVVPKDEDPYAPHWAGMSRFQRLCWYWQHTNEMLAGFHQQPVQLERILRDYDYLCERVLGPTGIHPSREQWARAVNTPINTSEQNRRMRLLRRWILRRPRDQEIPPIPHWRDWDRDDTQQFWQICGATMEKMDTEQRIPRRAAPMKGSARAAPPPSILLAADGLRIDGGIASVSRCIARALEKQSAAGELSRVDRVLLHENPKTAFPQPRRGVQKLALGSQARYVAQLWSLLLRHRHDLIIFDQVGLARSLLKPLPLSGRARYHIFIHGIELQRATRGSYRRAFAGASVILSNSEATARSFERLFPELAPKLAVTPLCIDPEKIELWARLRRPPDDPGRELAVLTAGRMWAEERGKGHDALLEGWGEVRRRVPEAQLWIVGEGDDRPRLMRKAESLQVADSVRFLGYVSDEEIGGLYGRAALFALPSKQEGFGLVYAEAMWHGVPCLAAISEAPREVLVEGETGVMVPYGDAQAIATALIELLSDRGRRAAMGSAGRRRAEERFVFDRFERDLLANLRPR